MYLKLVLKAPSSTDILPRAFKCTRSQNMAALTMSRAKNVGKYKRVKRHGSEAMWVYKCNNLGIKAAVTSIE